MLGLCLAVCLVCFMLCCLRINTICVLHVFSFEGFRPKRFFRCTQGFTYIFSSGQTFFTSEVFTASQRRRARQSRRDRDAQWFGTWDQWEPRGFRRTSGSWGDMDMHDFWDRVFGGQHFGEEQGEEKPEEDTGGASWVRETLLDMNRSKQWYVVLTLTLSWIRRLKAYPRGGKLTMGIRSFYPGSL